MTESMSKCKKKSKLPIQINQGRPIIDILRSKDMNVKQEKESNLKKVDVKQEKKQKRANPQKHAKKLNAPNMILKCNKEMYEYQNQRLNLVFKQTLHYHTLTQNELDILSMKYKVDGHYRASKDLPSFTSLVDSMQVTNTTKSHACERRECTPNCNMQHIKSRSSGTVRQDEDTGDSNMYDKTLQTNFRHDWLTNTGIHKMNNLDTKPEDKYLYADQTCPVTSDCNRVGENNNTQAHNNANTLNGMHNLSQEKVDSNAKDISGLQEESFPCSLVNGQNIISDEHQTYGTLFCNAAGPSIQHEIPQQNGAHNFSEHNDIPLNSDYYNDLNFAKWNTTISTNKDSNCQSWKNVQSACNPHMSYEDYMKDFTTAHQLMLIKDHVEQQADPDYSDHPSTYSLANNKNLTYASNNNITNVQQDINAYAINSNRVSGNFPPDTNTFISYCSGLNDQYN